MQMTDGQIVLAIAVGLVALYFLVSGGLVRLLVLFCFTAVVCYGVEWLVFLAIRIVVPHVAATGLGAGLVEWAYLPPLLVAGFVTITSWREGT